MKYGGCVTNERARTACLTTDELKGLGGADRGIALRGQPPLAP